METRTLLLILECAHAVRWGQTLTLDVKGSLPLQPGPYEGLDGLRCNFDVICNLMRA